MRIIAFINDASTVGKILDHVGESPRPPRIAPARGPPLWEAATAAANDPQCDISDISAQPVPDIEFDQRIARSSWGDSRLWPGERPPADSLRATGSAWQVIREAFLRIESCRMLARNQRLTAAPSGVILNEGPLDVRSFGKLRESRAVCRLIREGAQVRFIRMISFDKKIQR